MKIRHYADADTTAVHALYEACHPTWPAKPPEYWWAHPTLVLETEGEEWGPMDRWDAPGSATRIIGATNFSVGPAPHPELATLAGNGRYEVGWGGGTYVDPAYRGKGYGWLLAEARYAALRALNVPLFFGMTQPNNRPMLAILDRLGCKPSYTIPNAYPDGRAGIFYSGEVH